MRTHRNRSSHKASAPRRSTKKVSPSLKDEGDGAGFSIQDMLDPYWTWKFMRMCGQ